MNNQMKLKLKGTVLFTVISVMSLLIIFLLGTLVLASSASNRAHKSYSTSQAKYTARMAIESVADALGKETVLVRKVKDFNDDVTAQTMNITVSVNNPRMSSMGRIESVVLEKYADRPVYNEKASFWSKRSGMKITATVSLGGITDTSTAYLIEDPNYVAESREVELGFCPMCGIEPVELSKSVNGSKYGTVKNSVPDSNNKSNPITGCLCNGSCDGTGNCQTGRDFNQIPVVDSSHNAASETRNACTCKCFYTTKSGDKLAEKGISSGGGFGTACSTNGWGNVVVNANSVIKSQESYEQDLENLRKLYEEPEFSKKSYWDRTKTYAFNNDANYMGNVVINGSLKPNTYLTFSIPDAGYGVSIWGDLTNQNAEKFKIVSPKNMNNFSSYTQVPYLYVDGNISLSGGNGAQFGSKNLPLNVFCGSFTSTNLNDIYADIYMMDRGVLSNLAGKNQNGTGLYAWSASVINKTRSVSNPYTGGNIFCKGNIKLASMTVDGNVIVEGDADIANNVTINGYLYVGGTLSGSFNVNNIKGPIYTTNMSVPAGTETTKPGYGVKMRYARGEFSERYSEELEKDVRYWTWYNIYTGDFMGEFEVHPDAISDVDNTKRDDIGNGRPYVLNLVGDELSEERTDAPECRAFTDPSGNPCSEFDAKEFTGGKRLAFAQHPDFPNVYPREMEKRVILGLDTLPGFNKADTQIVKTIYDILREGKNPYDGILTSVPSGDGINASTNLLQGKDQNQDLTVTVSGTLTGTFNRLVTVKPANPNNNLWLILDNYNGSQGILIDDEGYNGEIHILIKGTCQLEQKGIITKTYDDLIAGRKGDFQFVYHGPKKDGIQVAARPPVYVHSVKDGNPKLTLRNNAMVTAFIEAPYLTLDHPTARDFGGGVKVYFDSQLISGSNTLFPGMKFNRVAIIGSCTVKSADVANEVHIIGFSTAEDVYTPVEPKRFGAKLDQGDFATADQITVDASGKVISYGIYSESDFYKYYKIEYSDLY